jgi:hypothetical protein
VSRHPPPHADPADLDTKQLNDQTMSHIDFIITQSSIDNGRLYFESAHTAFFPADTFAAGA